MIHSRDLFVRWMCASATMALSTVLNAQESWPVKPVRFIVPVAPAGAPDRVNRLVAEKLSKKWGQQVLIENRPSVGLIVGTEAVAKAAPDGYTLLSTLTAHVQTPFLFNKLPFDTVRDFLPITQMTEVDVMFAIRADLPFKNMKEFLAAAKSPPAQFTFGSTGQGSTYHLNGSALAKATGANLLHVPYKSEIAAMTDLAGGRIDASFSSFPSVMPMIQAGRVRPLALVSSMRSAVYPELPIFSDIGVTRLDSWFGLLAPRGTPVEIVRKVSADVREIVRDPETTKLFAEQGIRTIGSTPEEFAKMLEANLAGWKKTIGETGLKAAD
ncbi:MAG: Bug family tripartite tricarboxylate transporter substrate binding protein [Burkholderiales bacterium]